MEAVGVVVSLIALAVAIAAFQKAGGIQDVRRQVDHLSTKSEETAKGAREATANVLSRLESMLRGEGDRVPEQPIAPEQPKAAAPTESADPTTDLAQAAVGAEPTHTPVVSDPSHDRVTADRTDRPAASQETGGR